MLSGTGFSYRFNSPTTVTLIAAAVDRTTRTLGPVRVEGMNSQATAGINGSTDPTATEHTGSYTSSALTIGSKAPQSIKETPQSVSVITQQRMQDQNLADFAGAMEQATGITMIQGASSMLPTFYSRGFGVEMIQVDGGAPLSTRYYFPQIDLSMYDHVELLRGAAGLFNGYGTPSGSVNLTRKRPLDHTQFSVEAQAGSWNQYRTVLDATAPIGFDGRLRGRAVMTYHDQDYFYDVASTDRTLTYAVFEADLTPETLVSAGFSVTRQNSIPWYQGLMRYSNGDDLRMPRDTSFALPWNRMNLDTKEIFARLQREFGDNWSADVTFTRNQQDTRTKYAYVTGSVAPDLGIQSQLFGELTRFASHQRVAEMKIDGSFELFGQRQQVVIGANWQDVDGDGVKSYGQLYRYPYPNVDAFHFDPSDPRWREPSDSEATIYYPTQGQRQWGAYANVRLTLWAPLHLITGVRYSHYETESIGSSLCRSSDVGLPGCTAAGDVMGAPFVTRHGDHALSWPPTVSVVYDISPRLSAYVSYTDIYQSQASSVDRNRKPVDPLTGGNFEAGLKLDDLAGRFNATLAAFLIEQKNQAVFAGEYIDLGAGAPEHLLKLWSSYRFQHGDRLRNLSIGGGLHAQTKSYNSGQTCIRYVVTPDGVSCDYANGGWVKYQFTQDPYVVLSGRMAYQFDARWSAALNVNNITDRTYYQTMGTAEGGNWYGEPRSYTLTLRGQF